MDGTRSQGACEAREARYDSSARYLDAGVELRQQPGELSDPGPSEDVCVFLGHFELDRIGIRDQPQRRLDRRGLHPRHEQHHRSGATDSGTAANQVADVEHVLVSSGMSAATLGRC